MLFFIAETLYFPWQFSSSCWESADGCLLGCCGDWCGRNLSTFQRYVMPASSGQSPNPEDSHLHFTLESSPFFCSCSCCCSGMWSRLDLQVDINGLENVVSLSSIMNVSYIFKVLVWSGKSIVPLRSCAGDTVYHVLSNVGCTNWNVCMEFAHSKYIIQQNWRVRKVYYCKTRSISACLCWLGSDFVYLSLLSLCQSVSSYLPVLYISLFIDYFIDISHFSTLCVLNLYVGCVCVCVYCFSPSYRYFLPSHIFPTHASCYIFRTHNFSHIPHTLVPQRLYFSFEAVIYRFSPPFFIVIFLTLSSFYIVYVFIITFPALSFFISNDTSVKKNLLYEL